MVGNYDIIKEDGSSASSKNVRKIDAQKESGIKK